MSTSGEPIRLATRGSDLALRQAGQVQAALEERRNEVELVEVQTRGDEIRDELIHELGTTGAFARSLDEQVLSGEVDAAVHSMKDLPTEQPEDLVVAAIPERASAGDLLVTPEGATLAELPEGATVGTASLRRGAQLRRERPDVEVAPLRGNVDTRVEKLLAPHLQREHERRLAAAEGGEDGAGGEGDADEDAEAGDDGDADEDAEAGDDGDDDGEDPPEFDRTPQEWFDDLRELERRAMERAVDTVYDAIVLAAAGLERSGLRRKVAAAELPADQFVPAPGQAAMAVTARDGDEVTETLHRVLDDPRTRVETTVERTVLAELGGGCVAPLGAHAVLEGAFVHVDVVVLDRAGEEVVAASRDLPVQRHAATARELAGELAEQGAAELVAEARRAAGEGEAKRGES
jgi:hydroxymethylbilane synthase